MHYKNTELKNGRLRAKSSNATVLSKLFLFIGFACIVLALANLIYLPVLAIPQELQKNSYTAGEENKDFRLSAKPRAVEYVLEPTLSYNRAPEALTPKAVNDDKINTPQLSAVQKTTSIKEGDTIGTLTIPALDRQLPIIEGTRTADLKKGVGHFVGSVMPGYADNSVLSGHRDTVFKHLDRLVLGDLLIVDTPMGQFTYEISTIKIVEKDDRTIIVPSDHSLLTVTTCYPFRYIGSAPQRYILQADLVAIDGIVLDATSLND